MKTDSGPTRKKKCKIKDKKQEEMVDRTENIARESHSASGQTEQI